MRLLAATFIVLATWVVYLPALHGPWLWDDTTLIAQNPLMKDPAGLVKIWTEPSVLVDYFPLTVFVEWIESQIFGTDTWGFHFVSIALHTISALLVWRLLAKLGLRLAWLGGLLFAVHPVMVESVAWIEELKNTLSLPLLLLAMSAWIDWDRDRRPVHYIAALALFLLAALAKATVLMLPVVLLVYAWWRRGRIGGRDFVETAPFFAVALVLGIVTVNFVVAPIGETPPPWLARIQLGGLVLAFYFAKAVLPIGLMPIYPKWALDPASPWLWAPWPIFAALFLACWSRRATWGRHALLGLGFFFINLAPFLGLNWGAYMGFTWAMEHMLYVPMVGIIGLVAAVVDALDRKYTPGSRWVALAAVVVLGVPLIAGSYAYAALYADPVALWDNNVRGNPASAIVRVNDGEALAISGRVPEAAAQFQRATELQPTYLNAQRDLAKADAELGQYEAAIRDNQAVVKLAPHDDNAAYNIGNAFIRLGKYDDAQAALREALAINPKNAAAHYALGGVALATKRLPDALREFQQALAIEPNRVEFLAAAASTCAQSGEWAEAAHYATQATTLAPQNAQLHAMAGLCLAQAGQPIAAIVQYREALQIAPNNAAWHAALGDLLNSQGDLPGAIAEYRAAEQLNPGRTNLGEKLAQALALARARGVNLPQP